jgi:hypothetical protein
MAHKRTSLDALLEAVPPAAREPPPVPALPLVLSPRPDVKQQTVYLPLPVYEQLRRLAFEERVKMHQLLLEGLDRVFRDRGLPDLGELKGRTA